MKKSWYNFVNTKSNVAELSIFDEIGAWGCSVSEFLEEFNMIKDAEQIILYLNSPGGNLADGLAIYNILATVRDKLTIEVLGMAGSAAALVALAGKELIMDEGTFYIIHNPYSIVEGESQDLRDWADMLDKMKEQVINIYTQHCNLSAEELSKMMDDETWLTADEAVAMGFATSVNRKAQATKPAWNLTNKGFNKVPKNLIKPLLKVEDVTIRDLETILRDAGFSKKDATTLAGSGYPKAKVEEPQPSRDAEEKAETIKALKQLLNSI